MLKPSERIRKIIEGSEGRDYHTKEITWMSESQAIIRFLDEQYTKQEEESNWNQENASHNACECICENCKMCTSKPSESSTPIVEECTPGNCPFSVIPDTPTSWGMSPEGWAAAKERHNKYHQ